MKKELDEILEMGNDNANKYLSIDKKIQMIIQKVLSKTLQTDVVKGKVHKEYVHTSATKGVDRSSMNKSIENLNVPLINQVNPLIDF